jgi:hypothetical protein
MDLTHTGRQAAVSASVLTHTRIVAFEQSEYSSRHRATSNRRRIPDAYER